MASQVAGMGVGGASSSRKPGTVSWAPVSPSHTKVLSPKLVYFWSIGVSLPGEAKPGRVPHGILSEACNRPRSASESQLNSEFSLRAQQLQVASKVDTCQAYGSSTGRSLFSSFLSCLYLFKISGRDWDAVQW
jgi:hypothetical protein